MTFEKQNNEGNDEDVVNIHRIIPQSMVIY